MIATTIALINRVCDYASREGKNSKPCLAMSTKAFWIGSTLYCYCDKHEKER